MAMSPAARPAPGRRWTAALAWALAGLSVLALAPAGRLATLSQRARLPSAQLPAVAVGAVILATVSTAAVPVVATLASVVQPDPLAPDWYGNPLAVPALSRVLVMPAVAGVVVVLASLPVGAASLVGRFRHARGVERQQLRWLALAAILGALLLLVALVAGFVLSDDGVVLTSLALCVALLPLATGAAILRYRLYDLDRIISRTLAWTLLTLLLALAYAAVVLGLGRLLPQNSNLGVAAATLAVAALFQPSAAASSRRSTAVSTGAATTPPGSSRPSGPGCATRSTWTPCTPSCWPWSTRPCSPPGPRCGCGPGPAGAARRPGPGRGRGRRSGRGGRRGCGR
jgi:hypothetical protein